MQKNLDDLPKWCDKWRININIKKTEIIVFSGEKIKNKKQHH